MPHVLEPARSTLRHPEACGNVLSMSDSHWRSPAGTPASQSEYTARRVIGLPRLPLRFFLAARPFEVAHGGSTGGILETNRHLRDMFEARGYPVIHREYASGHDYYAWRGVLADGLLALFPCCVPTSPRN